MSSFKKGDHFYSYIMRDLIHSLSQTMNNQRETSPGCPIAQYFCLFLEESAFSVLPFLLVSLVTLVNLIELLIMLYLVIIVLALD